MNDTTVSEVTMTATPMAGGARGLHIPINVERSWQYGKLEHGGGTDAMHH